MGRGHGGPAPSFAAEDRGTLAAEDAEGLAAEYAEVADSIKYMHRLAGLLSFVFCVAVAAHRATPQLRLDPPKAGTAETEHLTIKLSSSDRHPAPRISLFVDIAPKPKMHVYAPEQKEYIPVKLTVDASDAYKQHAPTYPPAEKFFFKPLNETQLVYSKPFRIVQELSLAPRAGATRLTITGVLRYQACDDAICYLPKTVPLNWNVVLRR